MSNNNEAQAKNTLPPLAIEIQGAKPEASEQHQEATPYTGTKPGSVIVSVPSDVMEKTLPGTKGQ